MCIRYSNLRASAFHVFAPLLYVYKRRINSVVLQSVMHSHRRANMKSTHLFPVFCALVLLLGISSCQITFNKGKDCPETSFADDCQSGSSSDWLSNELKGKHPLFASAMTGSDFQPKRSIPPSAAQTFDYLNYLKHMLDVNLSKKKSLEDDHSIYSLSNYSPDPPQDPLFY